MTAEGQGPSRPCPTGVAQVDATTEAARRPHSLEEDAAIGFETGHEMNWLPRASRCCATSRRTSRSRSKRLSPELAEALVHGRLDVAFLRVEPARPALRGGGRRAADRRRRATIASPAAKRFTRGNSSARSSSAVRTKPQCCAL